MSWFSHGISSLFGGGGKNPAKAAMPYIDQIPGQTQPHYQPYEDAGAKALKDLQDRYGQLLNDPGAVYSKIGEGYKESPGYKLRLQKGMDAANNAMAMNSQLGTPQHQQLDAEVSENIASQDYNDYIKNVMGLYGQGMKGEEGINQQGYDANKSFADLIAQALGTKGQYAFGGQAGQNQMNSQSFANLISMISTFAPGLISHFFPPGQAPK